MTKDAFRSLVHAGPVLLDGATGTNLMAIGLPRGVCAEQWILEHPEAIHGLQRSYLEAGSQILYAPTFSANALSLAAFGLEAHVEEMNTRLVALCRETAGNRALVAGDVTTVGKPMAPQGDLEYQDLYPVYQQQILALSRAGVDLIVAETLMGVNEAVVILEAAHSVCDLPVICSLSLDIDGRAYFDGTALEAVETLQELGADAVGVNCSSGPDQLASLISNMKKASQIPILAKPNAGLPIIDAQGHAIYSMDPDSFARYMLKLVEAGASLVGGCCGTNASHITALKAALAQTYSRSFNY